VLAPQPAPQIPDAPQMPPALVTEHQQRLGREPLGVLLLKSGVGHEDVVSSVAVMQPLLDVRRMRPSEMVGVRLESGKLSQLTIRRAGDDGIPQTITVTRAPSGAFESRADSLEIRKVTEAVSGVVKSTLYESMIALGESPSLINQFVDVFGSAVDFYREVYNGDAFKLVVEKRYAGDRFIGYGRVVAAEYRQASRTLRGFAHTSGDGRPGYYDDKGRSLLTAFLKTPMEFTRITSRFGSRFHPVLKENKAHNGVDYGAPTGTPVWSVADGKVLSAAYQGACGNAVMIQHSNGILTGYCHLSRFGAAIKTGMRINQKQVIGYVGTTGRSTGPHLHFLMKKNGGYVNPQTLDVPRKQGLAGAELEAFKSVLPSLATQLDAIPSA